MFDHLLWWQVLVLLSPVVGLTYYVRHRELLRLTTAFKDMTPQQKAWIVLNLLPPGISARIQLEMEPDERVAYLEQGQSLQGQGPLLYHPVIKEFVSFYSPKEIPSVEGGQLIDRIGQMVSMQPPLDTLQVLRQHWPAPHPTNMASGAADRT